jgi:FMN phosphatase YigB (HAD superfamily)
MQKDTVIFDLDGTLALIDARRALAAKPNGKINWGIFFDPSNITLDMPNDPVITMAKLLKSAGYKIVIFSGRSGATQDATQDWLAQYGVEYDQLVMRPATDYTPDNDLKQTWLNQHFPGDQKDRILCVYDDRDQVVKMWRDNGLTCMQVAPGNF